MHAITAAIHNPVASCELWVPSTITREVCPKMHANQTSRSTCLLQTRAAMVNVFISHSLGSGPPSQKMVTSSGSYRRTIATPHMTWARCSCAGDRRLDQQDHSVCPESGPDHSISFTIGASCAADAFHAAHVSCSHDMCLGVTSNSTTVS